MKKISVLFLTMAVALSMLAGCGKGGDQASGQASEAADSASAEKVDPMQVKTIGEALALRTEGDQFQSSYSETTYVMVLDVDGVFYRYIADLPADVSEALWNLEWDDEHDAKEKELLDPLEIKSAENLTEKMPSQEEIDSWVGKKGQELFDAGWSYGYYDLESMTVGMDYGDFAYDVQFEYDGEQMVNDDDFDFYAAFSDLTVSSVTITGVGDGATNIEEGE